MQVNKETRIHESTVVVEGALAIRPAKTEARIPKTTIPIIKVIRWR
jgi:hypothetical protein